MKKILFVIPEATYGSAGTQLGLVARGLPPAHFACRVCVLGGEGPLSACLRNAGVAVDVLSWRRVLDGRPLWRLRRLLGSFRPDFVHAWRPAALRAVALAAIGRPSLLRGCAVIVNAAGANRHDGARRPLEQWLLRRADCLVFSNEAEIEWCRSVGLTEGKSKLVRPGVDPSPVETAGGVGAVVGAGSRYITCVGPLEPYKGFHDAVWAFDILRYLYDDLHMMLIGAGSDRERLERFVRGIGAQSQVHWLGQPHEVQHYLQAAEVVWVPSRSAGGAQVALEAMASGRPVVASSLPGLVEIVVDGVTGFLVPPRDRPAIARRTRVLLDDEELRRSMGQAGRQRAAEQFGAGAMAQRFAQIYNELRVA